MKSMDIIRNTLNNCERGTFGLIEDMRDAPLTQPTSHGGNHPHWVLGHLTLVEGNIPALILGEKTVADGERPCLIELDDLRFQDRAPFRRCSLHLGRRRR